MTDSAGVVELTGPAPPLVVVDTSAAVCALIDDEPQHDQYADFFERAIRAGTELVYCELVDFELVHAATRIALKRELGKRWRSHTGDPTYLPAVRDLTRELFDRWLGLLSQTSSIRLPLGPLGGNDPSTSVRDAAFGLLDRYPIGSYDAAHAATAILAGAPLVCRDAGFSRIPADTLTLITDRGRAQTCREQRRTHT